MNQVLTNFGKANSKLLKSVCLILSATCALLFTVGCNNVRSVSGNKSGVKIAKQSKFGKRNKTVQQVSQDTTVNSIEEFARKLESAQGKTETDESKPAQNFGEKKLLTLREQMQILASDQDQIKSDVNVLQQDVREIKSSLNEIKDAVTSPKDGYYSHANAKAIEPEPEPENTEFQDFESEEKYLESDYDDVIVSDEVQSKTASKPVAKKTPQVKKAKKIAQATKTATAPKTVQQPQKVKTAAEPNNFKMTNKVEVTPAQTTAKANEHLKVALANFSKKDYQKAINSLNSVLTTEKDPETVSVCSYWLGESYFRMGQYQNAVKCFNTTVNRTSSKTEEAKIMIGEANLRSGKVQEAKQNFERFIAEYPKSRYVARAKKLLQQI